MSYRDSYATNLALCDRVFELLERVFPGVRAARIGAELLGATWGSVSTPFVRVEDERVVSHVGLLVLPLHVMGRAITVGGVHGVATHPDFRRRGYYRALMEELLPYADQRYQTLVLTTA